MPGECPRPRLRRPSYRLFRKLSVLGLLALSAGSLVAQSAGPLRPRRPPPAERAAVRPDWNFTGMMISMLPDSVEIEMVGGARVICRLDDSTAYATPPGDFFPGDRIAVDSPTGPNAGCRASWVGRPEQRFSDNPGTRLSPAAPSQNRFEGRVELAPKLHDDPLIARAMQANRDFGLVQPNFICRQTVSRATSKNLGKKWKELDVLGADVIILDDDEHHRNITRNGRPTGARSLSQVGGTWSTGEYSGILWNLFAPESNAEFTRDFEEEIRGRQAAVYRYKISQKRSRWTINFGGGKYIPGHRGRVWIDVESARALRIEMEALGFPITHPLSKAETTIDFAMVPIREQNYLLPIESLTLACFSGSARCDKNRIEFTDYRKFETESSVFTTQSDVDFGDDPQSVDDPEPGEDPGKPRPEPR